MFRKSKLKHFETPVILGLALTLLVTLSPPASAATLFEEEFNTDAGVEFYTSAPYSSSTWRERVFGTGTTVDWSTSGGQLLARPAAGWSRDSNYSIEVDVTIPANVISNDLPVTVEVQSSNILTDHSRGPTVANVVTNSNRNNDSINLRHWTEWGPDFGSQTADQTNGGTDPITYFMTINHVGGVSTSIDMATQVGAAPVSSALNFAVDGSTAAAGGNLKRLDFSGGILPVGFHFASGDSGTEYNYIRVTAIPEPASWLLLALGLSALVGFRRRRRK